MGYVLSQGTGGTDTSEVTATASDVRSGKKGIDADGEYFDGELEITASKILSGQTIGGIEGTATSDATATAIQILSGATAYVNGVKVDGEIESMDGLTITPSSSQQTVACSGKYMEGDIVVGKKEVWTTNSYTVTSSSGTKSFYRGDEGAWVNLPYLTISNSIADKKVVRSRQNNSSSRSSTYLAGEVSIVDGISAYRYYITQGFTVSSTEIILPVISANTSHTVLVCGLN